MGNDDAKSTIEQSTTYEKRERKDKKQIYRKRGERKR
jgi:hypothetical protein